LAEVTNISTTLSDMVGQVYNLISENRYSSVIKESDVVAAINAALYRISKKVDRVQQNIKTSIVAGSRSIEIPDGYLQGGRVLVDEAYIDEEAITPSGFAFEDTDEPADTPTEYFVNGKTIFLAPTSDGDYTLNIRYRREPVPLSADDDTTYLGDDAVNAAIRYSCYMMKLKDEEYTAADRFKGEWDELFREVTSLQSGVYKGAGAYGGAV